MKKLLYKYLKIPLNINLFRKQETKQILKQSVIKRGNQPFIVDLVSQYDESLKQKKFQIDCARHQIKMIQKQRKSKDQKLTKQILILNNQICQLQQKITQVVSKIGNIVHQTTPTKFQKVIKEFGKFYKKNKGHFQICNKIGVDTKRGIKISGHRGYFLTQQSVILNLALIQYSLDFLIQKNYLPIQPPFIINQQIMKQTCQLSQIQMNVYKVQQNKCLIATSQQPISAYYKGQWIDHFQLPKRFVGLSHCFRKQAGAHGKDNLGIIRVHQFQKIQQFIICQPQYSQYQLQKLIQNCEQFYKSLNIPYRIIDIEAQQLNAASSKKYDLQAWFPYQQKFRQLCSCSNCTDYQSRMMDIRLRRNKQKNLFVHMLNGTLCATQRTICALLQNNQQQNRIIIPQCLHKYMKIKQLLL